MHVNPAYTGLMSHRARVGIDHRAQWTNFYQRLPHHQPQR